MSTEYTMTNAACAFEHYLRRKAETKAARERHNSSAAELELALIRERLAEMASQHNPLAALCDKGLNERDRLYASAHYVVVGRMPEILKQERSEQ